MANVWRIHIKPKDGVDSIKFALEEKVLGIGWSAKNGHSGMTKGEYFALAGVAATEYGWGPGWLTVVDRFVNDMQEDDLCWTRDTRPGKGDYYLGRLTGDWHYTSDPHYETAGFSNVRRVHVWERVGLQDEVPGKVVANFRASAVVNPVTDSTAAAYSKVKFNEVCRSNVFKVSLVAGDIFALLSAEDLEDIVGLYLQEKGLRLIPSTCKLSTPAYEYLLKSKDGKLVGVQVKSGGVPLNQDDYRGPFYLFASGGVYTGQSQPSVMCIPPEEMRQFIAQNFGLLPGRVQTWVRWMEQMERSPMQEKNNGNQDALDG